MATTDSKSDSDLWKQFDEGDVQALEQLYVKHHDRLLIGLYRHIGDIDIAKNVLQDVFLQLLEEGSKNKEVKDFFSWMTVRLYRHWYKIYHKENNRAAILKEAVIPYLADRSSQEHPMDRNMILRCISSIKNDLYQTILFLTIKGYDNSYIAERLGKEESYIRKRKYEARKSLRTILQKFGLMN